MIFFWKLKLKAQLYYKYGTIYREVMHTPLVDYCRMTGDTLGNPMIKAVMSVVEDSVPGLIHSCPYVVRHFLFWHFDLKTQVRHNVISEFSQHLNVSNANFRTGSMIISIFSSGDYKVFILGNFGKDENIGNITAFATVSSSNKDTFGWRSINWTIIHRPFALRYFMVYLS